MAVPAQNRQGATAPTAQDELVRMPLLQHLEELRRRIIRSLLWLSVAVAVSWFWADDLLQFLARPIYKYLPPGQKLAVLSVTDPFFIYFKTALLAGVFIACPLILWEAWQFIAPGLYEKERRWERV